MQAVDDAYMAELKKQVIHMDAIQAEGKNLKIVYSPLHGTGNIPARRILKELGFENVYVVPEQELPNGDFPTVSYPNPEAAEAFELGLKLAKEVDADLVLATDPDADRLGVRVKDKNGEYHDLTGNMSGCLLANYELSQRKAVAKYKKNTGTEKLKKYDYTSYEEDVPYYTMIIKEDGHKIKLLLDLTEEMLHTMKTQFPEKVYFA